MHIDLIRNVKTVPPRECSKSCLSSLTLPSMTLELAMLRRKRLNQTSPEPALTRAWSAHSKNQVPKQTLID